jgi:hypothetical protein
VDETTRSSFIADLVELARRYGRYGYRKIAALLRSTAGWVVNDKRVKRIWRLEGLKVRIPTEFAHSFRFDFAHLFRFEAAHHSEMNPPSVPI